MADRLSLAGYHSSYHNLTEDVIGLIVLEMTKGCKNLYFEVISDEMYENSEKVSMVDNRDNCYSFGKVRIS